MHEWMHSLGATAGYVQYHMLRGALVIRHIKASPHGNPLYIQQLFLKGNPQSITSQKPLLHQVSISNATFDAYTLSQSWQNPTLELPLSLANIFSYAKSITLNQSLIQRAANLPDIYIQKLQVSGKAELRKITGEGYTGTSGNSWSLHSQLPEQRAQQTGELYYQYNNSTNQLNWSGAWKSKNLIVTSQHNDDAEHASLQLTLRQDDQQWSNHFQATSWPVSFADVSASLSGSGTFSGSRLNWTVASDQLNLDKVHFRNNRVHIRQASAEKLHLNTEYKQLTLSHLLLKQPSLTMDIDNDAFSGAGWDININAMDVEDIQTRLIYHDEPIKLPPVSGNAKVTASKLQFALSTPAEQSPVLKVKSNMKSVVRIEGDAIPLVQLRNLLPDPIQQQATSLNGEAAFHLTVLPLRQWQVAGEVTLTDAEIITDTHKFSSPILNMEIIGANSAGIQHALLSADAWKAQFPLTPKHAWSDESYLDLWALVPWRMDTISLNHGSIAIGQDDQVWLHNAGLEISDWQADTPAKLKLTGTFGTAPLSLDMTLHSTLDHEMQWQSLIFKTTHADLFALSDWLQLSELPVVNKGHLSVELEATRKEESTHITSKVTLDHMQLSSLKPIVTLPDEEPDDFYPSLATLLDSKKHVTVDLDLQAQTNWSSAAAKAFSKKLNQTLNASKTNKQNSLKENHISSLYIHEDMSLSHNERVRLRKVIKQARTQRKSHIELRPDLGTNQLDAEFREDINNTQALIENFFIKYGIKQDRIYLVRPQQKHQSRSSSGAIHIFLVN